VQTCKSKRLKLFNQFPREIRPKIIRPESVRIAIPDFSFKINKAASKRLSQELQQVELFPIEYLLTCMELRRPEKKRVKTAIAKSRSWKSKMKLKNVRLTQTSAKLRKSHQNILRKRPKKKSLNVILKT